jgi:transcription-repair coupling factor (superfamily II helicase)
MSQRWFDQLCESAVLDEVLACVSDGGGVMSGRWGSSTTVLCGAMAMKSARHRILVTAHLDQADEAVDELLDMGVAARRFPAMEILPGETGMRSDLLAHRISTLSQLGKEYSQVLVAPIAALMQPIPPLAGLDELLRTIVDGESVDRDSLLAWLDGAGWARTASVERPGEYAVRGDVLDIFPELGEPVRVDFFGDDVESLRAIDLDTMGSGHALKRVDLIASAAGLSHDAVSGGSNPMVLGGLLDDTWDVIIDDPVEVREQARAYLDRVAGGGWIASLEDVQAELIERCGGVSMIGQGLEHPDLSLPVIPLGPMAEQAADAVTQLQELVQDGRVVIVCQNDGDITRMDEMLGLGQQGIDLRSGYLHRGFCWGDGDQRVWLIPYHEVVHRYQVRRRGHPQATRQNLDAFVEIKPGDYVVHGAHGIAQYIGTAVQPRDAADRDDESLEEFLVLEFSGGSRLLVPAERIEDVHRYIGAFKGKPDLSKLGGIGWEARTQKAAESVRDLAAELLRVQAVRNSRTGLACPPDGPWQRDLEASFPWEETEDQVAAIGAVAADMQSIGPMDRLLCGDVGFGKTEVAIRAAFRAAAAGRQVAVLVPTTVLAEQHERTFRNRFAGFPFRVESISRFKNAPQQRAVLEDLARGRIDVIIGTHRLLSKDVIFKELGLVVVDEEQRFGVEHKQRLIEMRSMVDILTMTATPIPRTLHMAMMGLRDISSLQSPPVDRRAVLTEVMEWDTRRLKAGLQRELAREGQAFVVHNRVIDLDDIAQAIHELVPDARIVIGHGQMTPRLLEKTMLTFMRHEADILVSTTIVESGIDIPNANTMIINEADRFGLADLHQLRGRVGRSRHRGYCYLLLPMTRTVRPEARRRLQAIESFSMLGAGFRIALRDLEIRGAGNLLGPEQSGHIAAVGYELYCRLLEQAVHDLKHGGQIRSAAAVVDLGWRGYFPSAWIPSEPRRLDAYRRLGRATTPQGVDDIMDDLQTAYGPIPKPANRAAFLASIAAMASNWEVQTVLRRERDIVLMVSQADRLLQAMSRIPGKVRIVGQPSSKGLRELWWRPSPRSMELDIIESELRGRLGTPPPTPAAVPT